MNLDAKTKTWLNQLQNGNLDNNMVIILNHIKMNPGISTDKLRTELQMAHQTLTACISGLLDCGIIEIKGEDKEQEDSFYSCYNFVNNTTDIIENQKKRTKEKFDIWVKRGLKDFIVFLDEPTMLMLQKCQETLKKAPPLEDIKIDKKGQTILFN